MKKRYKFLIGLSIFFLLVGVGGIAARHVFLDRIAARIEAHFGYAKLHLSMFPPALVLEEARSKSVSPFFSAKRIAVGISLRSLLSKERPLTILVEKPSLRIHASSAEPGISASEAGAGVVLPFSVEKGLVRDGSLYFWGEKIRARLSGINARFTQKGSRFSIQGEALENAFSPGSGTKPIMGRLAFLVQGRGEELEIRRLKISSPWGVVRASGHVSDLRDPEVELRATFNIRTGVSSEVFGLPLDIRGYARGEADFSRHEGDVTARMRFSSQEVMWGDFSLGKVEGRFDIKGQQARLDCYIQKTNLPREHVRVHFGRDEIRGEFRRFYLDPVIRVVGIPWPVASPGWGTFRMKERSFTADVEFRDETLEDRGDKYEFQGLVRVEWDRGTRFAFSSDRLETSFASLRLDGGMVLGRTVDMTLSGEVKDVSRARAFTSLILEKTFPFPEITGRGDAEIRIFGNARNPDVHARFSLSPGGFAGFEARSVRGEAEIRDRDFYGDFFVDDASLKGRIDVFASSSEVRVDALVERGQVEELLPGFGLSYPLSGEVQGRFAFFQNGEGLRLDGNFSGDRLFFSGQPLSDVSGRLVWTGETFSFPEVRFGFHRGEVTGSARWHLVAPEFALDITGKGIDISAFAPRLQGTMSFSAKGEGVMGRDAASGTYEVGDLLLYPFQKTETHGNLQIRFTRDRIDLDADGNFEPGENRYFLSLGFPLGENIVSGEVRGFFTNFDLLLPWSGAKGRINYLAEIRGTRTSPQARGAIDFTGPVFPFPQFAHALRDYSGLVFFDNGAFSLRSLKGKLGGGDVQGSGRLLLDRAGVQEIDVRVEGKNLFLAPMERTQALADGNLRLVKDARRFVLEGEFLVHRMLWRREITEKFMFSSAALEESPRRQDFFEDLNLNIRLRAEDNAWMDNALGQIRCRFDLRVMGNIYSPILLGDIETLEGELTFQDREFRILQGRVSFINPLEIEPYLSFKGETYVKDYRVTFSLEGPLNRLNPEFSSSPPLPPEDVLALLALGEAFKRTYSYDKSTQLSTASLLSFQLSEEAKKRAEGLFSIDRFRIDPFILGSSAEMTARLTVGKKISRNFFILYSTNLTTQREEIARLEWEISDDLSIVGTRDEKGRISFDVKIHKRF